MLSSYKKNNPKYHLTYTFNDFQKMYSKDDTIEDKLDKSTFLNILKDFFQEIKNEIIYNQYNFFIPKSSTALRIKKIKNKSDFSFLKLDYKKSRELNKKVYHLNNHSNGFYFRFYWDKRRDVSNRIKYKVLYRFYPVRTVKKELSDHIINSAKDPHSKEYDVLKR